jgi:hypothetical protein
MVATAASVMVLGIVYAAMGRGPTAAALLTVGAGYAAIAYCYRD